MAGLWFLMAISVAVAVLIAVCHWLCNTRTTRSTLSRLTPRLRPVDSPGHKPGSKPGGGPRRWAFDCGCFGESAVQAQRAQRAVGGAPAQLNGPPSWLHGSSSSAAKLDLESGTEGGAATAGSGGVSGGGPCPPGPPPHYRATPQDSAKLHAPPPLPAGQQLPPPAHSEAEAVPGSQQSAERPDLPELLAAVRHVEQLLLGKHPKGA